MLNVYRINESRYMISDGSTVYELPYNPLIQESSKKLSKIKRIILIGETNYLSVQNLNKVLNIKTEFIKSDSLNSSIKNDKIELTDEEKNKVVLSSKDKGNTIVFIKSGYNKKHIQFILKEIAEKGIIVINSPEHVMNCADKAVTYELLNKFNILQPKSVVISSNDVSKKDTSSVEKKLKEIYPQPDDNDKYVCKLLSSHGGHGVFVCRNKNLISIIQAIFAINKETKILVQEFIETDKSDLRVNVLTLNGKQQIINSIIRKNKGKDFRTNLSLGNESEETEISAIQKTIALRAAEISGLVWAGVDIMHSKDNKDYIIEINGAPGTPYDVNDSEELLKKNSEFYIEFIKMIDELA